MQKNELVSLLAKELLKDNSDEVNGVLVDLPTKNGRYLLEWNFIYRNIENTVDDVDDVESHHFNLGPLWESVSVIYDNILYLFYREGRFNDVIQNYERNIHHHLLCLVKAKNRHLNGEEGGKLSSDLFNDLDDKEITQDQIQKAKELLGSSYDQIKEVQVFSIDKKVGVVNLNRLNSFGEVVFSEDVTEVDYSSITPSTPQNEPEKPIPGFKKGILDRKEKIPNTKISKEKEFELDDKE